VEFKAAFKAGFLIPITAGFRAVLAGIAVAEEAILVIASA